MNITGSLCNACLGSTAPGTTGRKRGVLLLSIAILIALYFQYVVGPNIVTQRGWVYDFYRYIPGAGPLVYHAWYDNCAHYATTSMSKVASKAIIQQCAGNAGVFRPMTIATNFFKYAPNPTASFWKAKRNPSKCNSSGEKVCADGR